ncbi:MAG: zf-HC2 domain-containing protein [Pseudomonadota bacterium]
MNCPDLLVHTLYADGELSNKHAAAFEAHLRQCACCEARQHAIHKENQALRTALHTDLETFTVPQLNAGPSIASVCLTMVLVIGSGIVIDTAWQKLELAASLPGWLNWLAPSLVDAVFSGLAIFADFLRAVISTGGPSLQSILWWMLPAVLILAIINRRSNGSAAAACVLCFSLSLVHAPESAALDIRHHEDRITITANEVIDDTVIVAAEQILIEGDITGDLIAVGEKVSIRSKIGGNVIAFAEELDIESAIKGTVITAGERITIEDTGIDGNLFIAGENIRNDSAILVGGNILLAAKNAELAAQIGRELWAAASSLTFTGTTAKDLQYYGGELEIGGTAQVGGDLHATVADEASFHINDYASVGGERSVELIPEEDSEHSSSDFYFGRLMKLLAAFLFGLIMYWLFPSLRFASALDGRELLASSAFGAIALITTPLLAILVMFTLIGLPVGIAVLLLWIIAMYAAPVAAGALLGDAILSSTDQDKPILALLLGLVIFFVLASIPVVGTAVRFIALIIGLGIIVRWIRDAWSARDYAEV